MGVKSVESESTLQNNPRLPVDRDTHADSIVTTRRGFLRGAANKAVYVAPFVAVLGSNSEALANSNDGIPWSQCASLGESCGAATCCLGYECNSAFMCQPMM